MRRILPFAVAVGLTVLAVAAQSGSSTTKKKSSPKAVVRTGAVKKGAARKGVAKKGKAATQAAAPGRSRQLTPTPQRYQEIQQALAAKGYLPSDQANGQWTDASADALKRFQADQNLDATGKINSLSLIALGLGPKYDAKAGAGTTAP